MVFILYANSLEGVLEFDSKPVKDLGQRLSQLAKERGKTYSAGSIYDNGTQLITVSGSRIYFNTSVKHNAKYRSLCRAVIKAMYPQTNSEEICDQSIREWEELIEKERREIREIRRAAPKEIAT